MDILRYVSIALVSYILYYCINGDMSQILRAIKIVYYLLNVVENIGTQHALF
jgi:hypothetical protein